MKKKILIFVFICFILANLFFVIAKIIELQRIIKQQKAIILRPSAPEAVIPEVNLPARQPIESQKPADKETLDYSSKKALNLNLRLLGVIYGQKSVAFIELIDEKSNGIFLEGDEISGGKIVKILKDKIVIAKDGGEKIFRIDNPEFQTIEEFSIKKITSLERAIDRKSLFNNVIRMAQESNNLKIETVVNNNRKTEGLKVSNIPQQGIIKELGLENNDIIKDVNGFAIKSIPNAIKVYRKVRKKSNIEVGIIRNNIPMTLKYQFLEFK